MKAIATCVALAMAAPGAAAEPWRAWPSWTFVEAGSIDLRARIDTTWGGLGALVDPPRRDLAWTDFADHLAVTVSEAGAVIERARPVRELARPRASGDGGFEIAILFVVAARGRALDGCAYVERADTVALICGADVPAAALRDDFLARGAPALDARALHGEVANDRGEPVRAIFDATEDDAGLHLRSREIARSPSAVGALSAAARAAALRLTALPADVTATVIDGEETSKVDGAHFFLDRPIARVFGDELAQLRASARASTADARFRFTIDPAPAGLPRGARIVRTRFAMRSPGQVMICTPGGPYGECTTRRVPRHTDVETYAMALVPDGDGTWTIDPAGDAHAFFATSAPASIAMPPAWTATARSLGVMTIEPSGARIWWARTRGDGAELTLDVEGRAAP